MRAQNRAGQLIVEVRFVGVHVRKTADIKHIYRKGSWHLAWSNSEFWIKDAVYQSVVNVNGLQKPLFAYNFRISDTSIQDTNG